MVICPQIALSLLAGWEGRERRDRSKLRSSVCRVDHSTSRHHARTNFRTVATPPPTLRVYAVQGPSVLCVVGCGKCGAAAGSITHVTGDLVVE
ncbi:hypothetical protein E2C01_077233 [Portunus trituberculatus]|uniref:Uncharacterized protein n=1 Tax=Portunus trituberculatus TaxID=210409 RepID=A0A5B7IDV3_PORTR|nr:hypothetical protein [Portunus trituberculatus]